MIQDINCPSKYQYYIDIPLLKIFPSKLMQRRQKRNSQTKTSFPFSNPLSSSLPNPTLNSHSNPTFNPTLNPNPSLNPHPSQSQQHIPLITAHPRSYQLPLYQQNWSIYLQLLLLDALTIFGPQNWYAIAQYLNCQHNAQSISKHYYRIYGYHIGNQNQGKLGDLERKYGMFIQQDYDIYVQAQKREEYRKNKEYKQSKQAMKMIQQPIHIPKIPAEFGYEPYKKTFGQPYNQQAQIMIINLKFDPNDSQQQRQSKIKVLKMYNDMITQRQIVQKQVMKNGLMECKYSLSRDSLTIKIPKQIYDSQSQSKSKQSKKKGRNSSKKSSTKEKSAQKQKQLQKQQKKSKYIKNQLFFRIKKRINDEDLCQDLHVVYMKIKKYDQQEKIKNLLKTYQQKCKQLQNLKDKIQATSI